MSSLPKNMGWPPSKVTAASVETRVRVLRLLNIMATVLPVREVVSDVGALPALTACLRVAALRTKAVNSLGVNSLMDMRCLGPWA